MLPPFAFRALRALGVLLVPLGLVCVVIGAGAVVGGPSHSTAYGVEATATADTGGTPLDAMNESRERLARAAIENGRATGPQAVAESLDGETVRGGETSYRMDSYRTDGTDPLTYVLYVGLLSAFLGAFLAGGSHLVLRVRPD